MIEVSILVKKLGMGTTATCVGPNTTVLAFKTEMCEMFKVPLERHCVVYMGQRLPDDAFVMDFPLVDDSSVMYLVNKLKTRPTDRAHQKILKDFFMRKKFPENLADLLVTQMFDKMIKEKSENLCLDTISDIVIKREAAKKAAKAANK